MIIELETLKHLRDVFQTLSKGYHLSNEDFGLYHELQDHEAVYEELFAALGYTLHVDRRGFCYMTPEDENLVMNVTTRKMALLLFLVVEYLADSGRDPLTAITRGSLDLPELTEGLVAKAPEMLKEAGMGTVDAVAKVFATTFTRFGFAAVNGNIIRFRPPVHRFLDVCIEFGVDDQPTAAGPPGSAEVESRGDDSRAAGEAS